MESKSLADKLDENLFSSKIFNKIYVVFAFIVVLGPIIETFFACFGVSFSLVAQCFVIELLFIILKILETIFNRKDFSIKKFTVISWLLVAMFLAIMISNIVNGVLNENFIFAISFFAIFAMFSKLDKKWYKPLAFLLIVEMTFSTFLGLLDLGNDFIPSFHSERWDKYAMSMQFFNPNWSSLVVIISVVAAFYLLYSSKKLGEKIFYLFAASFMSFGLYVGGSYAPETALYLFEFGILLYLWIKYKKCPWWILSAFLINVASSFIVWFVPAFRGATTASANYFYESLAVIDNNIGTNLVEFVSEIFNKLFGWDVIKSVPGADGWTREDLKADAMAVILSSPKSFIFGLGSGYIDEIRVHNVYYVLWMEFGIIGLLIYLAIAVLFTIKFIKSKKSDYLVFLFAGFLMLMFASMYCCIEAVCYHFMVILFAVFYKELKAAEQSPKKQKKEEIKLEETNKTQENSK